jgi:hypothetical protein
MGAAYKKNSMATTFIIEKGKKNYIIKKLQIVG